ncbi:dihydrolipoyl dehydrogenase [uncultured Desulfuromonas sp.]|uniref:dihydrolipoyl dehydrogenase n=1 Tax=uncultured Desulfuromonas sp. TaxID=181013 RepID=UPI002605CDA6|nr:dihydrolipoyl dehydrogenase [uncultured Desulfuromonas sp.]
MKEFDVAIVGAGPGGYVAAIRAAQAGACVCLIEDDEVGGTCLNRGCIPTKALYSTARLMHHIRSAGEHGIRVGELGFDFPQAARRKDQVVEKLVRGVEQLLKGHGVEVFRGRASLEGEGRIRIRRAEVVGHIRARRIILATGSLPARPKGLPVDGKNVLTSNEILAMKDLPRSLLVVGGGYIGCEFASIFSAFGTKVTVVELLPTLLGHTDRLAVREVEKSLREAGVAVHTGTAVEALDVVEGGVKVRLSGGESLVVEKALVAVGRVPNSHGLGLEEAGVRLENGAVAVDDRMATSAEGVYAIGDVTGGIQLAHVASYQAGVAVTNALGGDARADYRVVPSTIFTLPEIGQVGLSEAACKEKGIETRVGRFAYQASSKALCAGEVRGSVQVVSDRGDGKILGAAVVGDEASTLIAEVAAAMSGGMTAVELGEVIHSHPTLPEMIKEAAEDTAGRAVHKVGRKAGRAPAKKA